MRRRIEFLALGLSAVALAGIVLIASSRPASAVSAFVRQTNMSCNQCHTTFGGPVPNFTMTGKKFRSTGYRQVEVREDMESGEHGQFGERLKLPLLNYFALRLQTQLALATRPTAGGKWNPAQTDPTTRMAIFYVGPWGDHLGVWNEWYFHTLGSRDQEWSLDLASWDEYDIRWSFNPDNPDWRICMGVTCMPISDVMGFGPFPVQAGGNKDDRGEVQGLAHPNYSTVFFNGWMYDRVSWLVGANTGDTNTKWDYSNAVAMVAYALMNTNENELWLRGWARKGTDVLPLVTTDFVKDGGRDWSYRDAVEGVEATRPGGAGPYLAADVSKASTAEGEIRYARQDWGSHSFELVARGAWSKDEYRDGAFTDYTSVGANLVYTWRHTAYIIPYANSMTTYKFTDRLGVAHEIENSPLYGVWLGFKPTESFLVTFNYANSQTLFLDREQENKGRSISITLDYLL